jgi:DNA-binding transcriptional MerR regulator
MRLPRCCRRPATESGGDRDVGHRGLFTEPPLDSSGYQRYRAEHATDLVKIKTLAEAGVRWPASRMLLAADPDRFAPAIAEIGRNLQQRAEQLQCTRERIASARACNPFRSRAHVPSRCHRRTRLRLACWPQAIHLTAAITRL